MHEAVNFLTNGYIITNRTEISQNQTVHYVQNGFLSLQNSIQRAIVKIQYPSSELDLKISTKEFPVKQSPSRLSGKEYDIT